MRSYYSMFGLGNKTGIDAPGEVESYMGVGFKTWYVAELCHWSDGYVYANSNEYLCFNDCPMVVNSISHLL